MLTFPNNFVLGDTIVELSGDGMNMFFMSKNLRETFFLVLSAVVLSEISPFKKNGENREKNVSSRVEKCPFFIKEPL